MAYFTDSDFLRTLKYLGYSVARLTELRSFAQNAYNQFGDAIVTETQTILSRLDALDTLENTYATDSSNALIKADVLEWDPTLRQGNLSARRTTLLEQLSNIFQMPVQSKMMGPTRVYKG